MAQVKRLYRSKKERIIFGVCGGLAEYFKIDPILVRILFLLLAFGGGSGIFIYLVLAVITPLSPDGQKISPAELQVNHLKSELRDSSQRLSNHWQSNTSDWRNVVGLAIIAIGVLALGNHYLHLIIDWPLFFSIAVILIGVVLITKQDKKHN
ncbi:MAG TPA: PspC domain-containing protein [bacterium]|nr:PspC domain-containing protein [bacterium]HPT30021.1 PspC domain-containing protein [bacterium]